MRHKSDAQLQQNNAFMYEFITHETSRFFITVLCRIGKNIKASMQNCTDISILSIKNIFDSLVKHIIKHNAPGNFI